MTDQDDFFLRQTFELAHEGMTTNQGGPFGSLVAHDGEIVGRGYNQVTSTNDPTAHAEVVAIRDAYCPVARPRSFSETNAFPSGPFAS